MKTNLLRLALSAAALLLAPARAADVPISGLPAISTVQAATVVPVVDVSGTPTTKKATVSQLISGLPAATSGADGKMIAADKAKLDAATAASTASTLVLRDGSANFSANVITAAQVTGLASPTNATDAANKAYVDAAAAGLVIKTPAVAATAGSNVTLAGGAPTTLDGVTLHANDRVLVKDQTTGTENGIYFVQTLGSGANGTWARTSDADTGAKLVQGSYIFITGGTTNVQSSWTMVTPNPVTIGTSTITWNLFSQTTQILASNIIGQIVGSQIANAAVTVAKFATGLTPVEIVSTLPVSGNFQGRTVFLTTDSKLYRYNGSNFVATVPTADLTGQVTNTQIADNSISTPKLQANSIAAGNIAAGAVVAGDLAANAVTAGTIQAGAVSTSELAAGAVNASKIAVGTITADRLAANSITAAQIQAGSITADRLTISSLSAITANIGTITAGSLSGVTLAIGAGSNAVSITSSGVTVGGKLFLGDAGGGNPTIRATGSGSYASYYVELNAQSGGVPPFLLATDGGGSTFIASGAAVSIGNNKNLVINSGSEIVGPGNLHLNSTDGNSLNLVLGQYGSAGTQDGFVGLIINGVAKKIPFYSF